MILDTFYKVCVYICICLILLTLSINFVNGLGVFSNVDTGFFTRDESDNNFQNLTNVNFTGDDSNSADTGMTGLWLIMLTGVGIGGLAVAWLTRSPVVLGVYVFSAVFWSSYLNSVSVLNLAGYLPISFLVIGTTGVLFVWAGAIAGMLSGSG